MQQERMCPYCHGGNAPNAAQCQWCHRYLQTGSRRTWGWLLIGAGFVSFALMFLTLLWLSVQGMAGAGSALTVRGYLVLGGGALLLSALFILPGIMLVRWKKR